MIPDPQNTAVHLMGNDYDTIKDILCVNQRTIIPHFMYDVNQITMLKNMHLLDMLDVYQIGHIASNRRFQYILKSNSKAGPSLVLENIGYCFLIHGFQINNIYVIVWHRVVIGRISVLSNRSQP